MNTLKCQPDEVFIRLFISLTGHRKIQFILYLINKNLSRGSNAKHREVTEIVPFQNYRNLLSKAKQINIEFTALKGKLVLFTYMW